MKSLHTVIASILLAAMLMALPGSPAGAQVRAGERRRPGFLNADGTLRLDGGWRSLDTRGWDVQLDPRRGPVFQPADIGPELVLPGHWAALGSNGSGNGSISGLTDQIFAVAVYGTNVYVGGYFTNVNDNGTILPAADHIARWNGSHWFALGNNGAGDGSLNHEVHAIAVDEDGNVYAGGSFSDVNNQGTVLTAADGIAKWDGTNWSSLGSGYGGDGSIVCCGVHSVAVDGSNVYVGGNFGGVDNYGVDLDAADGIAMWDGANWSALGDNGAGDGSLNAWVDAIAISGGNVYAGGPFTDVNNHGTVLTAADYIARWDGTDWSALGDNGSGNGAIPYWVHAIAVSGNNVYAGGSFTNVNNHGTVLAAADYIAKWDGTNWSALGNNGAGNGSLSSWVDAIAVSGSDVYAGGYFREINNRGSVLNAADIIAKWNGTDWAALGSDAYGDCPIKGAHIGALTIAANKVYVGGDFWQVFEGSALLENADDIAVYTPPAPHNASFRSVGAQDGWVLESTEASNRGGTINAAGTLFNLGDDPADRQYRSILSFNTSSLPDNAVIGKVTLKIRKQGLAGTDPFTTHGRLRVDIRNPFFGTTAGLAASDFQAAAGLSGAGTFATTPAAGGWYSAVLGQAAYPYVNRGGMTQLRLRFVKDDNDDQGADTVKFYSGNALTATDRPALVIQYYLP